MLLDDRSAERITKLVDGADKLIAVPIEAAHVVQANTISGGTVTVGADSYDAAKRIVVSREKSICNGSTLTRNQAWGGDSVDCSRK